MFRAIKQSARTLRVLFSMNSLPAFLPASPALCQVFGPGTTWCSAYGQRHRIDYAVLPTAWKDFEIESRTLPGFEALQLKEDHTPVLLRVRFSHPVRAEPYVLCGLPSSVHSSTACQQERQALLQSMPMCPWHADVDQQFSAFVDVWRAAGSYITETQPQTAIKPFLTDATLHLAGWCKALRGYLHLERQERERRWCILVFAALRLAVLKRNFSEQALEKANTWFHELDFSEASAISLLHSFVKRLRRGVAKKKIELLTCRV